MNAGIIQLKVRKIFDQLIQASSKFQVSDYNMESILTIFIPRDCFHFGLIKLELVLFFNTTTVY